MRSFIAILFFLIFGFVSAAIAADMSFDPFMSQKPKQDGPKPASPKMIPMSANGGLYDLSLSDYDRERYDACRAEAMANGLDIDSIRSATLFLKAPFRNPACNKFVVDKMLQGMDVAMQKNPDALTEFKKSRDAQRKYDELKKAYTILNRGNPIANSSFDGAFSSARPSPNGMSATQLLSDPLAISPPRRGEDSAILAPEPKLPTELWAKDYARIDAARTEAAIISLENFNQRQANENLGASPLKSMMLQAEDKEKQNEANNRIPKGPAPFERRRQQFRQVQ